RRACPARTPLAVERDRVRAEVVAPEKLVEARLERRRLAIEPFRDGWLADRASEPRRAAFRVVYVALHLAERDRARRERAVGVRHAVVRILPSLIREPARRLPKILDETVPVLVAVLVDPLDRPLDVRPQ